MLRTPLIECHWLASFPRKKRIRGTNPSFYPCLQRPLWFPINIFNSIYAVNLQYYAVNYNEAHISILIARTLSLCPGSIKSRSGTTKFISNSLGRIKDNWRRFAKFRYVIKRQKESIRLFCCHFILGSVFCRPPEHWRHLCAGWRDVVACFDIRHVRHCLTISYLPLAPSMIPD